MSRLLDTVRQCGAERLAASGEVEPVRAALLWTIANAPCTGGRLAALLWPFWYRRGHYDEGRTWLELAALEPDLESSVRAGVLTGASVLAYLQCDDAIAIDHLEAALRLSRELGARRGIATVLQRLGWSAALMAAAVAALREYEGRSPDQRETLEQLAHRARASGPRAPQRGSQNREIGAPLFISPSTAGVHVSSILRKLGVCSRVKAAARAQQLGLLGGAAARSPAPPPHTPSHRTG